MPHTAPARRAELSETVKNLRAENKRMSADNARLREQNVALRIDLARATRTVGGRLTGPALSDIQIAATLLGELHDRLVGESRRTASPAAETALRLAAREVSKARIRLSQRGHEYPDGAGSDKPYDWGGSAVGDCSGRMQKLAQQQHAGMPMEDMAQSMADDYRKVLDRIEGRHADQ